MRLASPTTSTLCMKVRTILLSHVSRESYMRCPFLTQLPRCCINTTVPSNTLDDMNSNVERLKQWSKQWVADRGGEDDDGENKL